MNIGILGVGSFGEKHIQVLKNIKEFNLIGFFDPKQIRAKEIEKKFTISSYQNIAELITKCDALDIVSNTATHFELLKSGIQNNKHIFIEKPICSDKHEIEKILKLTKNYNKVIQVGHIERYNPVIKSELEERKKINSIITQRTGLINNRNKNTSITLDLMIHDIDLVVTMMKCDIHKIEASGEKKENGLYNHVVCTLHFKNGKKAKLTSSRGKKNNTERTWQINCSKQTIHIDMLSREKITTNNNKKIIEKFQTSNPLKAELIDFYNNITDKKKPKIGTKEACYATEIALKIDEQIGNNI